MLWLKAEVSTAPSAGGVTWGSHPHSCRWRSGPYLFLWVSISGFVPPSACQGLLHQHLLNADLQPQTQHTSAVHANKVTQLSFRGKPTQTCFLQCTVITKAAIVWFLRAPIRYHHHLPPAAGVPISSRLILPANTS